jgi:hypothetical protein
MATEAVEFIFVFPGQNREVPAETVARAVLRRDGFSFFGFRAGGELRIGLVGGDLRWR